MSTRELNPVSYVVLGLVARDGPSTPYDLKVAAAKGVASFWPFAHSPLYGEAERLADDGLLTETREPGGRRRRVYDLTGEGREALRRWVDEPTDEQPQIRSVALLKLFFGQFGDEGAVADLADAQVAMFDELLDSLVAMRGRLAARPDRPYQLSVLDIAEGSFTAMRAVWADLAADRRPVG